MPLRIVFCGTPAFAVPSLRHLNAQSDFQIVGVVTQPDRPRGRGQEMGVSAVKAAAIELNLDVYQPEKIKSAEAFEYFQRLASDAVVIIAYGQIISQRLIDLPRLGWINLHASLLPKYRGAAPINWVIVNGETHTGVTTMQIDAGLDAGPVLLRYETAIGADETASELTSRLAEAGAPLVAETLRKLDRSDIVPVRQQNSEATFAPLLKKEDGRIDWSRPAQQIYNRVRGLDPWPGAFTSFHGKACHVWGEPLFDAVQESMVKASVESRALVNGALVELNNEIFVKCANETFLRLRFVKLEGRKRVTAREFANGARLTPKDHFSG